MDTIFAVATPPGRGGVGVVRVSGPIIDLVCQSLSLENVPDRTAVLRTVAHAGQTLDQALVLRFPHGASFTGEDVLELHLHGSPAVRDAVLGVLASVDGCRPAEPGEFTRRALENGRMDLTEVEGLSALIDAETEAQRKQAQRLVSGGLAKLGDDWRDKIIEALALLEVTIDFADEEVPVDVRPDVIDLIGSVVSDLRREIGGVEYAERVREGFEVAIVGAPNAGKSTLLNALAGRDAALTSDIAGTTRDIIEVRMNLSGIPVTVLDTAGLRSSDDEIETMGVERAVARAASADLRVFLESDGQTLDMVEEHPDDIRIWGKSDAHNREGPAVSGLTGDGIDSLIERIVGILQDRVNRVGTATDDRHRAEMTTALNALELGLKQLSAEDDRIELASEEIRTAARALDRMIGRVDVESILDQIFSRFCLGK